MSIAYNHVRVRIHVPALSHNYKVVNALGGNCFAVVKSDAYGHGLAVAAEAFAEAGARTMAVGTVEEAETLSQTTFTGRIVSLLGPQLPEDFEAAVRLGVISFCGRKEQLAHLDEAARKAGKPAHVSLKFDTGMRRLGFSPSEAADVLEYVKGLPGIRVDLVSSHLATADMPERAGFVREQAARFKEAVDVLRAGGLCFEANLANSAAVMAYPEYRFDAQRPGIALYGVDPLRGGTGPGADLRPAMEVSTLVYQVRDLAAGESVSYGQTYTAQNAMRVAVVGVGYADNYSRGLSNKGFMVLHGRRVPILGRVCMQMALVDVSEVPQARPGDTIWLLGGPDEAAVTPDELADWWGTISYEAFCLLGMNRREYVLDSGGQSGY
ncbi:alanine racemase [Desulfocurvus sp. DL9XJH121]